MDTPAIQDRAAPLAPGGRKPPVAAPRSKYASRACQQCRQRRAKCDGKKPSCTRCLDRMLDCVFTTESDNRGMSPKSYVLLLQARVKVLEQVLWRHSIDVDASVAQLLAQNAPLLGEPAVVDDESAPAPDGALCFDEPLHCSPDGEPRYYGLASGRLDLTSQQGMRNVSYSPTSTNPELVSPVHSHHWTNSYSQALGGESEIPQELMDHLIDLYFEWEQPWCQVVDETLFRQSKKNNGKYFSLLLLNCILAVASRYSDRPEVRSDPDDPNTAGRIYIETAEVLLHFDLKSPTITTLQSLVLMGIFYVAIGSDAAGWLHQGMANRLALDMGLNLDPSMLSGADRLPAAEAELRRQIYWSLYCTDKLWASYTGRVCTMLDSQALVNLPTISNPDMKNGTERGSISADMTDLASLNRALCTHCQILEKILLNLYAPKRLPHDVQRQSFFDGCLLTLKGWFYDLPRELKIDRGGERNKFPPAYILNMVYHTSIILLTKPFLPRTRSPASAQSLPASMQKSLSQKASSLCLAAAKDICFLGEKYRQAFGSFRRSPITATHCTLSAVLVMLHAYGSKDDKVQNAEPDYVQSCTRTLQELSDSWTPPQRYWRGVQRMLDKRRELAQDSVVSPATHHASPSYSQPSEPIGSIIGDRFTPQSSDPGVIGFIDLDLEQSLMRDLQSTTSGSISEAQPMLEMPLWTEMQSNLPLESLPWDYTGFNAFSGGSYDPYD